jgi:hypothetical protein
MKPSLSKKCKLCLHSLFESPVLGMIHTSAQGVCYQYRFFGDIVNGILAKRFTFSDN